MEIFCGFLVDQAEVEDAFSHNNCVDGVALLGARDFDVNTVFALLADDRLCQAKAVDAAFESLNRLLHRAGLKGGLAAGSGH